MFSIWTGRKLTLRGLDPLDQLREAPVLLQELQSLRIPLTLQRPRKEPLELASLPLPKKFQKALGLMSDYLFGRPAEEGSWWASAVYAALPNWQLFWMADTLEGDQKLPWSYVANALGYVAGYLVAALAVGLALFEDRELG